ncbi:MAG: DUF2283 domain-containing protein [Chloroflexi bacterium]|nr:DUF2283 domain-containing protein [Chloroflexota bacterium]
MDARLRFTYDREADILYIDTCAPYSEQESAELGDDVVARIHPQTGEIENLEVLFFPHGSSAATCSPSRWSRRCAL